MAIDLHKINETPHLLDLLIEIEDLLDSLDVYVFKNWIEGIVVDGPSIRRYWVNIILQYPEKKMPDPRAGLRLLKHGILPTYDQATVEGTKHEPSHKVWLVKLEVPRKLLNNVNDSDTDYYDDEVDIEDVDNAVDMGVDTESSYSEDDANGGEGNSNEADAESAGEDGEPQ